MKSLADVNVLFALLVGRHVHHSVAWAWWEQRPDGSVGTCLPVRLGVLRLLTNAVAMSGQPVAPVEALAAWDALAADPRVFDVADIPAGHGQIFRQFVAGRQPAPNLWTDAWLAALAGSLACGLTSFDRGFGTFGLRELELLTPQS